jgi:hypothetical protein
VNLTDLHRRLLTDVLAVGGDYPLALTGGPAGWYARWKPTLSRHG